DVGDVGDPHLLRPRNFQVFDEVGITGIAMVAIGGALGACGWSAVDVEFLHPAAHTFAVHAPTEPAHHGGESAIAVGGPVAGDVDEGGLEHGLVVGQRACAVVDRAAWHAEQAADETGRVGLGELHDDLPLLLPSPGSIRD